MLPNWIQPFDILRPLQAGAGLGLQVRHADLAQVAEEQQAQRAADSLRLNYAQLAAEMQNRQAVQQQQAQNAAAMALHRNALERHQMAQEAQAMSAAESLNRFRGNQATHWTNQEAQAAENAAAAEERRRDQDEAKMQGVEPVVRDILGFGPVLINPKTGSIHTKPSGAKLDDAYDRIDYGAASKALNHVDTLPAERETARKRLEQLRQKQKLGFTPSAGGVVSENAPTLSDTEAAAVTQRLQSPANGTQSDKVTTEALSLPAKKEDLVKGSLYQTAKGLAIWDGEHFIAQ